ncbi:Maf family protein [Clavibacter michiganensis]|uniref:Nucleoside triphosphate pyrophosphatase n=1 Tax=Clavibacter michiganensis subsp. michiganensis TaxID=33013 RepID=A0A1Y3F9Y0_CLAMM|nr:Maf family protein [Clavibacter michiganensis]KAF0260050.1 Maf-like protein YceF [Clavibacter michiganensis subsp. michiganensis]MBE3077097.1 septum formation inhibitor Maf [Clavibacter michiganensis subsp. michiganensis]MBF4639219.1 septum formation inhibitor Maf [Clavibacter michiganensis subsp. michiganensis]MBW8025397.1 septum formation inhibitor Maf [Clavibacter michiganensis subsp. michiganensis]MDO4018426.1 Maf family protein [Clavibacter michiganensis]
MTTRLHLASTSPARLALLRSAGIEPVVLPSDVDEPAAVAAAEAGQGPLGAEAMVQLLARAKAEAVVGQLVAGAPLTGLVLGGDSAFEIDDVVHGKPHTVERATERWRAQRGREGRLHSGHWLIEVADGRIVRGIGRAAVADVRFRADITDAEIDAYVATGEPLLVAGSFTIDSLGAAFIERIQGDPSTVVGLSLPTLRGLVRELGTEWTDLWNRQGAVAARLL